MKYIFIFLLLAIQFIGYSQNSSDTIINPFNPSDTLQIEIDLDDSMDTLKCGLWETGDYKLFIKTQPFSESLQKDYSGLIHAIQNELKNDSLTLINCNLYAARCLKAINQLSEAENGVDLRKLVLYFGQENSELNSGNSAYVEQFVRNALEAGNAIVFYKDQRIYKLTKRTIIDAVMSTIKIYAEDEKNYAFSYFGYINW
jgi:hypothetical protein